MISSGAVAPDQGWSQKAGCGRAERAPHTHGSSGGLQCDQDHDYNWTTPAGSPSVYLAWEFLWLWLQVHTLSPLVGDSSPKGGDLLEVGSEGWGILSWPVSVGVHAGPVGVGGLDVDMALPWSPSRRLCGGVLSLSLGHLQGEWCTNSQVMLAS